MTKKQLCMILDTVTDDYNVTIDGKIICNYLVNDNNKTVNLSSDFLMSFVFTYNPLSDLLSGTMAKRKKML